MAKILVTYGTNSNGTMFASKEVEKQFAAQNHEVVLNEIRSIKPEDLEQYDLIIFGTNTWFYNGAQGQPHTWYFPFEESFRKSTYKGKKFAVFALGDSSYIEFCHSADYLEKMISDCGGELVAESLRIDGYYFDEEKNNTLLKEWVINMPLV